MDKAHRTDIEFNAEGVTLRGWLYRPAHADAASHLPVIIMTPGYNAIKELYLDCFAEYFAERGMIVLVYDNRNFGDSDGEPRGELDPWVQVRDYRHAITFAQQLPGVDPLRVGIWGSSYSGGHVLVVGAIDRRVKCVVSQVMTTNGYESLVRRQRPDHLYDLYRRFEQDRKARFAGAKPEYVPMVTAPEAPTGQIRSHASNDAFVFFTGVEAPARDAWRFKKRRRPSRNYVQTARSISPRENLSERAKAKSSCSRRERCTS